MKNWLWVVLIVVGSGVACALIWLYSNRKKIFKKRSKEEKKAQKEAKKIKKEAKKAPPAPAAPEKQKDELSFSEKQVEIIDNVQIQSEEYVPSDDFAGSGAIEYATVPRRMPRRRPQTDYERPRRFEVEEEQRESLKDQLRSLTPEMKAVVFGNLLDRKDDQF